MQAGCEALVAHVTAKVGSEEVLRSCWIVRLGCWGCGALHWYVLLKILWMVVLIGFTASSFSARVGFSVSFLEDYTGDSLEFGADAKHAFDTALFLGDCESGEKSDDLVHEFHV